jgi:hypothetical protein
MAPPWGLCVDAAENGFSIVSVRRPGFGETSPVSAIAEEVRLLSDFLEEAQFENAVMIVDGAARPGGRRLAQARERTAFTPLARPDYASVLSGNIEPWVSDLILRTVQTGAGASGADCDLADRAALRPSGAPALRWVCLERLPGKILD